MIFHKKKHGSFCKLESLYVQMLIFIYISQQLGLAYFLSLTLLPKSYIPSTIHIEKELLSTAIWAILGTYKWASFWLINLYIKKNKKSKS